jgi:hypothetical protein
LFYKFYGGGFIKMESNIILAEKVENKDRRFGSAIEYYPAMVETDGQESPALFTS